MNIDAEKTIEILDALKFSTEDDTFDINSEAVDSIFVLKRNLVATRKNEVEERKCSSCSNDALVSFDIDEYTRIIKTDKGFEIEKISTDTPEEIKEKYDNAIESMENGLLLKFAKKYVGRKGVLDSKYLRVAATLRSLGIVYSGIMPLMELSFMKDGRVNQSVLAVIKALKKQDQLSADIPQIIKSFPKNDDGSIDIEALRAAAEEQSAEEQS